MKRNLLLAITAAVLAVFLCPSAGAETAPATLNMVPMTCASAAKMETFLKETYGETPEYMGMTPNNSFIVVFTNREKNTYTIIRHFTNGAGCIVGAGSDWAAVPHSEGKPT
jgi:hypothetical protein